MDRQLDMAELTAALNGDDNAMNALVGKLTPVIQSRVARRLLGVPTVKDVRQDVKDLTQDIFLYLFSNGARVLRAWDAERGMSLENYVGLIAQRRAISALRSGKKNPWRESDNLDDVDEQYSAHDDVERQVIGADALAVVLSAMQEQLSPLGWQLFELLYIQEKTVDEVQDHTNMNADAIYAWRSRLRKVARQCEQRLTDNPDSLQQRARPEGNR